MAVNRYDTPDEVNHIQTYNPNFYPIEYVAPPMQELKLMLSQKEKEALEAKETAKSTMKAFKYIKVPDIDRPYYYAIQKNYENKLSDIANNVSSKGWGSSEVGSDLDLLVEEFKEDVTNGNLGVMVNNYNEIQKYSAAKQDMLKTSGIHNPNLDQRFEGYKGAFNPEGQRNNLAFQGISKYIDYGKELDDRIKGWKANKNVTIIPGGGWLDKRTNEVLTEAEVYNSLSEMFNNTPAQKQAIRDIVHNEKQRNPDFKEDSKEGRDFINQEWKDVVMSYANKAAYSDIDRDLTVNQWDMHNDREARKDIRDAKKVAAKSNDKEKEGDALETQGEPISFIKKVNDQGIVTESNNINFMDVGRVAGAGKKFFKNFDDEVKKHKHGNVDVYEMLPDNNNPGFFKKSDKSIKLSEAMNKANTVDISISGNSLSNGGITPVPFEGKDPMVKITIFQKGGKGEDGVRREFLMPFTEGMFPSYHKNLMADPTYKDNQFKWNYANPLPDIKSSVETPAIKHNRKEEVQKTYIDKPLSTTDKTYWFRLKNVKEAFTRTDGTKEIIALRIDNAIKLIGTSLGKNPTLEAITYYVEDLSPDASSEEKVKQAERIKNRLQTIPSY